MFTRLLSSHWKSNLLRIDCKPDCKITVINVYRLFLRPAMYIWACRTHRHQPEEAAYVLGALDKRCISTAVHAFLTGQQSYSNRIKIINLAKLNGLLIHVGGTDWASQFELWGEGIWWTMAQGGRDYMAYENTWPVILYFYVDAFFFWQRLEHSVICSRHSIWMYYYD